MRVCGLYVCVCVCMCVYVCVPHFYLDMHSLCARVCGLCICVCVCVHVCVSVDVFVCEYLSVWFARDLENALLLLLLFLGLQHSWQKAQTFHRIPRLIDR